MSAYQGDPKIKQSEAVIAKTLGIAPESVSITTGDNVNGNGHAVRMFDPTDDRKYTNFVITLNNVPGSDIKPEGIKAEIAEKLGTIAPLNVVAQWKPEEKVVEELVKETKETIAGTDFNRVLLDSPPVLKPEIVKKGWGGTHKKHLITHVNTTSFGIEFGFSVPVGKDEDPKPLAEKLVADIKQRWPEEKTLMTERVVKYTEANLKAAGKNEAEIKQALETVRANMAKLEIEPHKDGGRLSAHVTVSIRSPEQKSAFAAAKRDEYGQVIGPDNADALQATNPLHGLKSHVTEADPSPQLHKALARALFFDKDKKPVAIFPLVAGRMDLKTAFAKEFARILKENPDKKTAFDKILSSEIFQEHNKSAPDIIKDSAKRGVVEVRLSLTEKQLESAVEGLAALSAPAVAQSSAETIASEIVAAGPKQPANMIAGGAPTVEGWREALKTIAEAKAAKPDTGRGAA